MTILNMIAFERAFVEASRLACANDEHLTFVLVETRAPIGLRPLVMQAEVIGHVSDREIAFVFRHNEAAAHALVRRLRAMPFVAMALVGVASRALEPEPAAFNLAENLWRTAASSLAAQKIARAA